MQNAKKIVGRSIALVITLCLSVQLFAMEPFGSRSNQPLLQVYFSPEHQAQMKNALFGLLDSAKRQLHIAIYWITDRTIMDKIIAAKRRNVDVQIVIDESSIGYFDVVPQLLQNGIMPIIFPSTLVEGIMHHKFVEVDGTTVFTGSANFTKSALDEQSERFNFENVSVINSPDIAKQFIEAFTEMKKDTFGAYVEVITLHTPNELPNWFRQVVPILYQRQDLMQQTVAQSFQEYDAAGQTRIAKFFGIQMQSVDREEEPVQSMDVIQKNPAQSSERREDRITEPQKKLLNSYKFTNQDIMDLSKSEASLLIDKIKKSPRWKRVSETQRNILRKNGYSDNKIISLSYDEAYALIGNLGKGNQ